MSNKIQILVKSITVFRIKKNDSQIILLIHHLLNSGTARDQWKVGTKSGDILPKKHLNMENMYRLNFIYKEHNKQQRFKHTTT